MNDSKQQELVPTIQSERAIVREPVSSGAAMLEVIARAAADPLVDVAKMQALLEMKERIDAKESEAAFNRAMSRLQPRLPIIEKRGRIQFRDAKGVEHDTPYAKYEDIDAAIRPLLCDEGFSLSFDSEITEKGVAYRGTLAHSGGHSRTASMILPADTSGAKNSIQAIGSTVSYAKRYLVGMLLNIITLNQDDDGRAAGFIDEHQSGSIIDMLSACEAEVSELERPKIKSDFLKFMNAKIVSEIHKIDYEKAMTALRGKLRALKAAKVPK